LEVVELVVGLGTLLRVVVVVVKLLKQLLPLQAQPCQ
jgi:hypothetical protein